MAPVKTDDQKWRAGRVSINRTHGGPEGDTFRIELVDLASRTECVEIELSPLAVVDALSGLVYQTCAFRFRPERVGLRHEHKTEDVPVETPPQRRETCEQGARAMLAPFEVDGWIGRSDDLFNHRRWRRDRDGKVGSIQVHFSRWVEPEPGWEPEP